MNAIFAKGFQAFWDGSSLLHMVFRCIDLLDFVFTKASEGGESGGGIGDGGDFNVGVGVGDVDDRIRVLGKTINMLRPAHPEVNVHLLGGSHYAKAQPRSGLQRRSWFDKCQKSEAAADHRGAD